MATKRNASSAKKGSKKGASKKGAGKRAIIPPINLACIRKCVSQFNDCLRSGRPQRQCIMELQRCVANCARGGG